MKIIYSLSQQSQQKLKLSAAKISDKNNQETGICKLK